METPPLLRGMDFMTNPAATTAEMVRPGEANGIRGEDSKQEGCKHAEPSVKTEIHV